MYHKEVRNKTIYQLAKEGLTYAEIGKEFGISRQRVFDIVKRLKLSTGNTIDSNLEEEYLNERK